MPTKNETGARKCINKFLRFFPQGFHDEKYYRWERGYKWDAHLEWDKFLNRRICQKLLGEENFEEIAALALKIESKTNLLFSFEKMAIRDALKTSSGAHLFAHALNEFLYSQRGIKAKFERWCKMIAELPCRQTRVLTWPILTVFGFIAQPNKYIYFKPTVTRAAAAQYGFDLHYAAPPSLEAYRSFYEFTYLLCNDLNYLNPKDLIDIQSFIWVQGSSEFDE